MLICEFQESCQALLNALDIYDIPKGYDVIFEIVDHYNHDVPGPYDRIPDSGFPYQDNARLYASLVLAKMCDDLRNLVLVGKYSGTVKLLQAQVGKIAKLL